jgi:hypothetical protein
MPINYANLRSLTAREMISALIGTDLSLSGSAVPISSTITPLAGAE